MKRMKERSAMREEAAGRPRAASESWQGIDTLRHIGRHWLSNRDRCLSIAGDPHVTRSAHRHGMTTLLAQLIQAGRLDLGARHTEKALLGRARREAARSGYLLEELAWSRWAFSAEGIPCLTLLGPVLSQLAYGDPGLRPIHELELLVRPTDAEKAGALLRGRGYGPAASRPGVRGERSFVRYEGPGPGSINLRWRLRAGGAEPDDGDLWDRAVLLDLGTLTVPTLHPGDMALFLATRGEDRGWKRLEWLVAFASLGRRLGDWSTLVDRATAAGRNRDLIRAWRLAAELLDQAPPAALAHRPSALPDPASADRTPSPRGQRLLGRVLRRLRHVRPSDAKPPRLGKKTSYPSAAGVRLFFRPPVRLGPSRSRSGLPRQVSSGPLT